MTSSVAIFIDEQVVHVPSNISVAAAIAIAHEDKITTRISVTGKNRAPVCGMGICQECRVTINQQAHQLACQTLCTDRKSVV